MRAPKSSFWLSFGEVCYAKNVFCKKHRLTFNNGYDGRQKHVTSSVRWDNCIMETFQACILLILRYFRVKLSEKCKHFGGFTYQPHSTHAEHAPKPPSAFPTMSLCYGVGASHASSTKMVCSENLSYGGNICTCTYQTCAWSGKFQDKDFQRCYMRN